MGARALRAAAAVAAFGVFGMAGAGTALGVVVDSVPTPTWQTNGRVNVITVAGSKVFIGGQFTAVRPAGAPTGSGEVTRNHVAAFNLNTGKLLAWNPNANGTVRAIATSGSTVYLGGSFTQVRGKGHARLASVNDTTGGLVGGWHPAANAEVLALRVVNNRLYAGGAFTAVNGAARLRLAAFNTTTGALLGSWAPSADDQVKALTSTPDGSKILIGGFFTHIGSGSQDHIAALSPSTGAPLPWATHLSYPVIDLAVNRAGVYVAGAGGGGNFAGLTLSGGQMWQGGTNGNVQAIGVVHGFVYLGGHFQTYCGPQHGQHTCTNPIARDKLLAVDQKTGVLQPWDPGANSALGVFALTGSSATGDMLAGGDFTVIGGAHQQGYAVFQPS